MLDDQLLSSTVGNVLVTKPSRQTIPRRRWKQQVLALHRWLGLLIGALLLLQGASGASMLLRDYLEPLIHPELQLIPAPRQVAVQTLADTVTSANEGYQIDRVAFPRRNDRGIVFRMSASDSGEKLLVAVDPYRGQILRQGGLGAWPFELMKELHEYLLAGSTGELIIGFVGLGLLFMASSGLAAWWPAGSRFAAGFSLVRGKSRAVFWRSLHRATGGAIALVLVFSAATGTLMIFKDTLRAALSLAGEVIPKPSVDIAAEAGRHLLPIDTVVDAARARHGATPLRELRFFAQGRGVSIYLDAPDSNRPLATKLLAFDLYTGEERGSYIAGNNPVGNEIVDWLFPLHTGAAGGLPHRILLLLGGLSLVLLSASGIWLWVRGRVIRQTGRR